MKKTTLPSTILLGITGNTYVYIPVTKYFAWSNPHSRKAADECGEIYHGGNVSKLKNRIQVSNKEGNTGFWDSERTLPWKSTH